MKAFFFAVALFLLLSITLQDSSPVTPTSCDATEPLAEKALDLVNKGRQDGYLFQLLRVADAHLDKAESTTVYYLVLDVEETDCSVLSRKHWHDCKPDVSRRPSEIVIGKCKVIATTHSNEHQDLKVKDFNCTTSSVSSALSNTKDSPVLLDFFEDTDLYREQADKALEKYKGENADFAHFRVDQVERVARARGEEGTNYYVDFSVRNCSAHYFPRHFNAFGFCRADLYYVVGASDLETPKDIVINCEVFNLEEHRNISGIHRLLGHLLFSNGHKHPPPGQSPFKANGSKHHHHSHKSHKPRCPAPGEDKSDSDRPVSHEGDLPSGSRCHHSHFSINGTRGPFHNHNSSEHHPHGHHPHGHGPHGHHPHGHGPHGHHPHGHGHRPHGHHPHGHGPHGHRPHRHRHRGRRPHHRPHGHDFHDFGPCDPPPHSQSHHHPGHGPPHRQSEERGPDKGHFHFERRQIGYVYSLPPLKNDEVLPSPEANFPIFSMPNHNSQKPEIQPFPQSVSESCPGKFKSEFPQVSKFFADTFPK
ncbi:histidine-rich glycoprotein [Talpa occidentalis]|uniref:histidine-rich glycoprotein n=1 Tax=Talpa occidentalis TaxID=50954 RepID=UPI00188FCE2C|nr:histidine-rich glycoprotein [Talpa occidentalis]